MREVQRMTTHFFIRNSVYQFSQFYPFTNLVNLVNLVKRLLFSQFFGFLGNSYRYLRIYLLKAPLSPHAKKNLISSKLCVRVASRFAEQLKTRNLRILGNRKKIIKLGEDTR